MADGEEESIEEMGGVIFMILGLSSDQASDMSGNHKFIFGFVSLLFGAALIAASNVVMFLLIMKECARFRAGRQEAAAESGRAG